MLRSLTDRWFLRRNIHSIMIHQTYMKHRQICWAIMSGWRNEQASKYFSTNTFLILLRMFNDKFFINGVQ